MGRRPVITSQGNAIFRQGARLLLLGLALLVLFFGLQQLIGFILLLVTAAILALAIGPIIRWVRQFSFPPGGWRVPKVVIAIVTYIAIAVGIGLFLLLALRPLLSELQGLIMALPPAAEVLQQVLQIVTGVLAGEAVQLPVPEVPEGDLLGLVQQGIETLLAFAGGLVQFGLVIVLSLFFVLEGERGFRFVISLLPPSRREPVEELGVSVAHRVGRWALGELALIVIASIYTYIGMIIIGVPFPLFLALLAALLEVAPGVGPGFVAIPAALLGFTVSPLVGVLAGVYMIAMAQIDGNVLTPAILGQAIDLSPLLVLVAVTAGALLFGVLGAFLAVPVTAAAQVVVTEALVPAIRRRNEPRGGDGET